MNKILRALLITVGSAALLSFLLACGLVAAIAIPGDPARIETAAAALEPAPGWTVTQTRTEPPRLICLGDVACPSLLRMWSIPEPLSAEEFQTFVDEAGWAFPVTGECELKANISGGQTLCEARGAEGGFDIVVAQIVDRDGGPLMWLYVEETR